MDVRPPVSLNVTADDMRVLLAIARPVHGAEYEIVERLERRLRGRPVSDGAWRDREVRKSRERAGAAGGVSGRSVGRARIAFAWPDLVAALEAGSPVAPMERIARDRDFMLARAVLRGDGNDITDAWGVATVATIVAAHPAPVAVDVDQAEMIASVTVRGRALLAYRAQRDVRPPVDREVVDAT